MSKVVGQVRMPRLGWFPSLAQSPCEGGSPVRWQSLSYSLSLSHSLEKPWLGKLFMWFSARRESRESISTVLPRRVYKEKKSQTPRRVWDSRICLRLQRKDQKFYSDISFRRYGQRTLDKDFFFKFSLLQLLLDLFYLKIQIWTFFCSFFFFW